ncbi:MAG TPA: nitroreductase/quinone reductase family protein [Ornithinibacter sp.]|nr:nitroreductase/quinone reductase family protein [Ornithinibacter sp.]
MGAGSLSTRIGVSMYRRLDGRAMGGSAEAPVVLLTVPGRRSGLPRSACVRAIRSGEGYLVWGTGSGRPQDPDWFRNLRHAGRATVQDGHDVHEVVAVELTGDERDAVWRDVVLETLPGVERYAQKAGRTIPVARLTPTS